MSHKNKITPILLLIVLILIPTLFFIIFSENIKETIISKLSSNLFFKEYFVRVKQKETKQTISDYNNSLKLNPKNAELYYKRGDAFFELGKYDDALKDYSKAIKLKPNYTDAYFSRGIIYNRRKMYKEAVLEYKKVIKIDPNYIKAYYNIGSIFSVEMPNYKEAIFNSNKVIELNPKMSGAYYHLGLVYLKLEKPLEAKKQFELFLKYAPIDSLYRWAAKSWLKDIEEGSWKK
ncbi:MAG: tetratricopeptide repeat protein [Candidatus Aureabacteria bacterium]|nr:tetratricopeptide repeat protein [Candidatus Auribacterota bacterium]